MCGPNDDMTNPALADDAAIERANRAGLRAGQRLVLVDVLAEVWCSECAHPADGPDALCTLHRRLRQSRKPVLLNDFDKILIKMALRTAAAQYDESAVPQENDPYYFAGHREAMAELAAEYRRLAQVLA